MGERKNKIISKTFEYDLPDDYLYETNSKKLKGKFTYNGPDKIWVFVVNETGKLFNNIVYTERDDGDLIPTDPRFTKVCVQADQDPVITSMLVEQDHTLLSTKKELLPDGNFYERFDPTPPDQTYDVDALEYDLANKKWKTPLVWKKPHMTWEILKSARNYILRDTDFMFKSRILTQDQIDALEEYRQKLRDIPTVFKDIDPWKVPFPELPDQLKESDNG
jgi:hypothetical protein